MTLRAGPLSKRQDPKRRVLWESGCAVSCIPNSNHGVPKTHLLSVLCAERASTSLGTANGPSLLSPKPTLKALFSRVSVTTCGFRCRRSIRRHPPRDSTFHRHEPRDPPFQPPILLVRNDHREKMQESTNLPPRFPQPPEETTWYRSLWLQGFPSSQAGDGAHPQ